MIWKSWKIFQSSTLHMSPPSRGMYWYPPVLISWSIIWIFRTHHLFISFDIFSQFRLFFFCEVLALEIQDGGNHAWDNRHACDVIISCCWWCRPQRMNCNTSQAAQQPFRGFLFEIWFRVYCVFISPSKISQAFVFASIPREDQLHSTWEKKKKEKKKKKKERKIRQRPLQE